MGKTLKHLEIGKSNDSRAADRMPKKGDECIILEMIL